MKRQSFTNKRMETGILGKRFLAFFQKYEKYGQYKKWIE